MLHPLLMSTTLMAIIALAVALGVIGGVAVDYWPKGPHEKS